MSFAIGDRVRRNEDRALNGAVVLSVVTLGRRQLLELSYDEGGTGWWPADEVTRDDEA